MIGYEIHDSMRSHVQIKFHRRAFSRRTPRNKKVIPELDSGICLVVIDNIHAYIVCTSKNTTMRSTSPIISQSSYTPGR